MNTLISFMPLIGFAIIAYIIYRNIKRKTITTFTINSHQNDNNIYKGGEPFNKKERTIKPSWNKFTLVFFVLYVIVMYSKSSIWISWFEAIFPPYLIIYLIVKLVKWYKGLNTNGNDWYQKRLIADREFSKNDPWSISSDDIFQRSLNGGTAFPDDDD